MKRVNALVTVLVTLGACVAGTNCGGRSDHPPGGGEEAAGDGGAIGADGSIVVGGEDGGIIIVNVPDGTIVTWFDSGTVPPPDASVVVDARVTFDGASNDASTGPDASDTSDASVSTLDAGTKEGGVVVDAGPPDVGAPDTGPICAAGYHFCPSDAGSICADDTSEATCGARCSPCPTPANGVASCTAGACAYICDNGFVACASGCCSCGDTQTDPNNCGSCGHSCKGEACVDGVCGEVVVAQNQANAYAIAADDTNVYWSTTGASASILKAPVGGGGASVLVSSANAYPSALAVSGGELYWADAAGGTVNRVPVGGGTSVPLASGLNSPMALAVEGQLYFALAPYQGTGSILSLPLGGGTPTPIASGQATSYAPSIALSPSSIYWTTTNDVTTAPLTGGGAKAFAAQQYPYAVAADGANVYWTSGLAGGAVFQRSAAGGATVTIASNQYYPNTVAVDATRVYWTTGQGGAGTVMSAPIGGGAAVTIASNQAYPFAMALNATHVFWVNFGSGAIVSAPK